MNLGRCKNNPLKPYVVFVILLSFYEVLFFLIFFLCVCVCVCVCISGQFQFGDFSKIIMKEEITYLCTCFWSKQILGILLGMKGRDKSKVGCSYCWCSWKDDFLAPRLWNVPVSAAERAGPISPVWRNPMLSWAGVSISAF